MNGSSLNRKAEVLLEEIDGTYQPIKLVSRQEAVKILSKERGRSAKHPLNATLISRWCADLGFEKWLAAYTPDQMAQLRAVNQHYAAGGTRKELLNRMRRNAQWYA